MNILLTNGRLQKQQQTSYLGWTNKETYLFSLDIFDQDGNYKYWTNKAQNMLYTMHLEDIAAQLGEELKKYLLSGCENDDDFLLCDLTTFNSEKINFEEIAEELLSSLAYNEIPMCIH